MYWLYQRDPLPTELEKRIEEERHSADEARQCVEAREAEVERNAAEERQTHLTNAHQLTLQNAQLQEKIKVILSLMYYR